jgi:hypothetical protein
VYIIYIKQGDRTMREVILEAIKAGEKFKLSNSTSYLNTDKCRVMTMAIKAKWNCYLAPHEHTANCTYIIFPNSDTKVQIWINQG